MEYLKKNKTIIVKSSPENSYYKQLKTTLDTNNTVVDGLKQRNLDIVEDPTSTGFKIYLYGQDGSLHLSEDSFNEGTFNKVFSVVDGMTPKPSQSGGSRTVDYKEKYFKYKHKYEDMKDVITTFSPPKN